MAGGIKPDAYRRKIEAGHTHDKIAVEDPAAAPLDTDSETGGPPMPPQALAAATRIQTQMAVSESPYVGPDLPGRAQWQIPSRGNAWLFGALLMALCVTGLTAAALTLP